MKIGRKLRTAAATAAVGLASVVSAGCSMISEFNPLFAPNEISSTHKQRGQFKFGQQIENLHESGKPYTFNRESDTLYVRAEDFHDTLEEFGLEDTGTFNEVFETNRIKVSYTNPKTGEKVEETQIVPNDGTIDTDLGSFDAFGPRQKLDDAVTAAAREKFGDSTMEVKVQQVAYPMQDQPSIYLGQAQVSSPFGGGIVHIGDQPLDLQMATAAGPTVDTKYVAVFKNTDNLGSTLENGEVVDSKKHDDFVSRVVVYGSTGGFINGAYPKINFGHRDRLVGLGNRPLDNAIAANHKVGEYMDSVLHMTSGYVLGRGDVDFMANETVYLQSHLANNGKQSKLQKITGRIGEVTDAIGAVKGLGATARGAE